MRAAETPMPHQPSEPSQGSACAPKPCEFFHCFNSCWVQVRSGGHLAPRCLFLQQGLANSTCCAMVTWGPRAAPLPHLQPRAHKNVYTHPGGNAFIPSGRVLLGDARLPHPPHALHFPLVLPAQQNAPALCFLYLLLICLSRPSSRLCLPGAG